MAKVKVMAGTTFVSMDEPCFSLAEVNLPDPRPGYGVRRVRLLHVVRGDRLAEYSEDLGPADWYHEQLRVPGAVTDPTNGHTEILHTVGELCDIADWVRSGKSQAEQSGLAPGDLWGQWRRQQEEKAAARRHRSVFGPVIRRQRNG